MPFEEDPILLIAIAAVVIVPIVVLSVSRRLALKRLEQLSPAFELGTAKMAGSFSNAVDGIYRGYKCRYRVEYASQYSPGGAVLQVVATSLSTWSVAVSDGASRLFSRIGLMQDLDIGDENLDERLRFSAADPGFLTTSLSTGAARSALTKLVDQPNFKNAEVTTQRLQIQWRPRNKQLDEDPDAVRRRLEIAVELLTALGMPPG
jgi:hypothetical protein